MLRLCDISPGMYSYTYKSSGIYNKSSSTVPGHGHVQGSAFYSPEGES